METLTLPEILNIPPKMIPMITQFNKYTYFLGEGGRGSSKTQSVARFLLYLAEKYRIKICCGREIQNTINESVKTVFESLINDKNLNFIIKEKEIVSNASGSVIVFKGFREQGKVNIKGLADIDILWIDEAEAISKPTLDIIIPTIMRKKNAKIFFTMNRFVRNDAVYHFCVGRDDCLHIQINYFENPFLTEQMHKEAAICKQKNINDYNHIWLGQPLAQALDFLISSDTIERAKNLEFNKENHPKNSVMSIDLAASGGDLCVAKRYVQRSSTAWEQVETITWTEMDTTITEGKIVHLYGLWKPTIKIMDADGMGYPIWCTLRKSIPDIIGFRGNGKAKNKGSGNARADGYIALNDFLYQGWLKISCENSCRQFEYIKKDYSKKPGVVYIQDKKTIRKEQGESPDFADTDMMAVYAMNFYPYLFSQARNDVQVNIETDFDPFE